jgi:putative membrane protein
MPKVVELLGAEETARIERANHMPSYVAMQIAAILREGYDRLSLDRVALLQAERSRANLVDHLGGCERIVKTPLPMAYRIMIRRFIVLFLVTLPFALLPKIGWLTPLVTFMVAYPILELDVIGTELQNPFNGRNLGHLPLDEICATIEANVLALAGTKPLDPNGLMDDLFSRT